MRCRKCYISNKVPGVKLNEDNIFNLCIEVENKVIRKPIRNFEELKKYRWERPVDTGAHSSNSRLNDLGIRLHMEKYGFHPYEFEVTEQVRRGELTYSEAREKIDAAIDMKQLEIILGEFNA